VAVPEEVYTEGPSQEEMKNESEKIRLLLDKLKEKESSA
jgi:hypothetical protein